MVRVRFGRVVVRLAVVTATSMTMLGMGTPSAGALTLISSDCRAVQWRMNGVEGGTANALGSPCHTDRYQPIADRDVSLTLPSGTSIRVRTVGESAITYFDLVYPYPGTYQALAEFYSQEADIFINGVRLFGFEDTWVQVVKEVGADCSDPHSWITHWLDYKTLVGVSTYDSQESTVTIAPGVRMHRNYTEELEDGTTLVRGIWIENLPARTVDVTIGEVRARLNCSNINTD